MTKTMVLGLVAALAVAGVAGAQSIDRDRGRDRDRRGGALLYELPDFGGRQVEINGAAPNLNAYGFNDRAHSVRLRGSWRVCEHANFAGRCQELRGDVANLNNVDNAPLAVQGEPPAPGLFSFDKYSSGPILSAALREAADRSDGNDGARRLFLVPRAQAARLHTSGGVVTAVEVFVN